MTTTQQRVECWHPPLYPPLPPTAVDAATVHATQPVTPQWVVMRCDAMHGTL